MRSRKLGISHVRLLPKDTGVRPIVNLRRRPIKINVSVAPRLLLSLDIPSNAMHLIQYRGVAELGYSINFILENTFRVLNFEKVSLFPRPDRDLCQSSELSYRIGMHTSLGQLLPERVRFINL